jgi:hypothetical protein
VGGRLSGGWRVGGGRGMDIESRGWWKKLSLSGG